MLLTNTIAALMETLFGRNLNTGNYFFNKILKLFVVYSCDFK